MMFCRVEIGVVDPLHHEKAVVRQALGLVPDLEGSGCDDFFRASFKVSAQASCLVVCRQGGVEELSGGFHDQADAFLSPGYVLGISRFPQNLHHGAVDFQDRLVGIDDLDLAFPGVAVQKFAEGAVRRVRFHDLDKVVEAFSHFPPGIDDDLVEPLAEQVVPQGEFADTSQTVDAQRL